MQDATRAFLPVAAYVIEDASGELYEFAATRVAVDIESVAAEDIRNMRPYVLDPVEHMFVGGDQHICMHVPATVRAAAERGLAVGIFALLEHARATLLAGHHAQNPSTPFRAIDQFSSHRVSRNEAEARGLPIYPYRRG